ncbi:hypothetical protein K8S19_01665 [bacterium]|nr:hypothetical protein [bacterium]
MSKVPNGWQRIWIMLGIVLLLFPGLLLIGEIPTKSGIYHYWVNDTIELVLTLEEYKDLSLGELRFRYRFKE